MDATQIKAFLLAVGTTSWKMTYKEFCNKLNSDYSEKKWAEWRALSQALNRFDAETLAKLLN